MSRLSFGALTFVFPRLIEECFDWLGLSAHRPCEIGTYFVIPWCLSFIGLSLERLGCRLSGIAPR